MASSDSETAPSDSSDSQARRALLADVVGPDADGSLSRREEKQKQRRLKRGLTEAYDEGEFGVGPSVGTDAHEPTNAADGEEGTRFTGEGGGVRRFVCCLLYTSPSPRDRG